MFSNPFARGARVLAVLGAGLFLVSVALAQPAVSSVNSRYLLIFDTSSAMKSRVPASQYAVERLFFSMMNGQFQAGDSIGVWAFDRKLRQGEVPLQRWLPQNAATIASGITNFIRLQRYSKSTRFDVIMPEVNQLVRDSQRLTVLIFCDGDGEIKGTPYDSPINTILKQSASALRKSDETFIIVLRAQLGQYIGYTVNSSAIGVNLPEFPPLPAPPQPVALVQTNPPPRPPSPPPVIQAAPLIIIGTNVGTNPIPSIPPQVVLPHPPPVRAESNPPSPFASRSNSTNAMSTNAAPPKIGKTQAKTSAPSGETSGLNRNGALAIGAGLLIAAVALIVVVLFRSRKPGRGSLITRSMKKD
jgi:hypothetical protein